MRGLKALTPAEEAQRALLAAVSHVPQAVRVAPLDAVGRYAAEDVVSPVDVPPFDRAAFDGYAVRSADTLGASRSSPAVLRLAGSSLPGQAPRPLAPGEAVEVATGAPLPEGADAVVPYEEAAVRGGHVEVYRAVPPYHNVSRRGEDVSRGEVVLRRGRRIRPWDVGVLASLGVEEVAVYAPRVAIISTGSELVDRGPPPPGKIANSTAPMLVAMLRELGAEPRYLGIVPDDVEAIGAAVRGALEGHDMVITTGGVSVGRPDHTVRAVESLGPQLLIRGISIRPGRPTSAAVVGGKPVVMLSGYPVAAAVGFDLLARPALLKMVGGRPEPEARARGVLTRRVTTPINVRSYVRAMARREGDKIYVEPLAVTGSGILSTLTRANALLVVPENREGYDEGEEVEVTLLGPLE